MGSKWTSLGLLEHLSVLPSSTPTMKLIIFIALAVAAHAFPQQRSSKDQIPILSYSADVGLDGNYQFGYETGDGIRHSERGFQKPGARAEEPIQVAEGSFSYTAPDGTPISLTYVADENGFQPQGNHLPVAPPIPEAIQRALQVILARSGQQPQQPFRG